MNRLVFALIMAAWFSAFASKPAYKVVYELSEAGQKPVTASIIIEEGQNAQIKSTTDGVGATSFEATVTQAPAKRVFIDYRIKRAKGSKAIELAKSSVELSLNQFEESDLKDSSGNNLKLRVKVERE